MITHHSTQFLQKRKFFLVLPFLTLPFITLMFWALGGGQGNRAQAQPEKNRQGLNLDLPAAYLSTDKSLNKLSYYEKAASDSARLEKLMKKDPYFLPEQNPGPKEGVPEEAARESSFNYQPNASPRNRTLNTAISDRNAAPDPMEAKIYQKLEQVTTALQKTEGLPAPPPLSSPSLTNPPVSSLNLADIDQLEQMMGSMQNGNSSEDPEMQQLNGLLEKILDIQHPERVREKLQAASDLRQGQVLSATPHPMDPVSLLVNDRETMASKEVLAGGQLAQNGFYSLEGEESDGSYEQNTIPAVLHETQTVTEGSLVKLRLLREVYLNGVVIPAGTFVFGTATLQGERLQVKITSVRYQNAVFPVALAVCDLDGLDGIYIPGVLTREVARQSADQAVQGLDLPAIDPSLGAQAARASMEAAKTLLNKKARLVKVIVKAGYQVLLRDEKQKGVSGPAGRRGAA